MPNVVLSIYHVLTSPTTNPPAWSLNGANWITLFMIVLIPLAFLRRLDSLRHTSYIALFSVGQCCFVPLYWQYLTDSLAYLVVIVITCYFWPLKGMPVPGEIRLIHIQPHFVSTFPVQVFAFTCSQNVSYICLLDISNILVAYPWPLSLAIPALQWS